MHISLTFYTFLALGSFSLFFFSSFILSLRFDILTYSNASYILLPSLSPYSRLSWAPSFPVSVSFFSGLYYPSLSIPVPFSIFSSSVFIYSPSVSPPLSIHQYIYTKRNRSLYLSFSILQEQRILQYIINICSRLHHHQFIYFLRNL